LDVDVFDVWQVVWPPLDAATAVLSQQFLRALDVIRPFSFFFSGDLTEEAELLTWTLYQMRENTIENVNRDLLAMLIDRQEFLAVFFCKFVV
jgi:hypothetical protein